MAKKREGPVRLLRYFDYLCNVHLCFGGNDLCLLCPK